ncbi:MAG: metallophosphoesterase [Thermoprotei archaeon]|nr:MAG: metallophosphoesterase [Thermoprotei archaeon]
MAKIGILADTHDNLEMIERAIIQLEKEGVSVVVHAGDIIAPFSLKRMLNRGFKLIGVLGNNDGEVLLLTRLAEKGGAVIVHQPLITVVEGLRTLILHGAGSISDTRALVDSLAKSGTFDLIVYGHTHEVDVRKLEETLIVNPGEACGYLTGSPTLAVLDVESKEVEVKEL